MLVGGLVSVTFRDRPAQEIIRLCTENGLAAVEWGENAHVFSGDANQSARLRDKTLESGLEVACYGSYYRCEPENDLKTDFKPVLASALALGAPVIRVWAGKLGSGEASAEYARFIAQNAAAAADMAAEKGVRLAFEWHRNTLTDTNESAMTLLERANHPNLFCLWQPTPELAMDERLEGLRLLEGRLAHFHVYNWQGRERRPLAEGTSLDKWRAYFAAADQSVRRYALLEFVMGDSESQLAQDAAALNRFLGEINAQKEK